MARDDVVTRFAVAMLLGSLWALIPVALSALAFIVRTALEDKTLQRELDGYADYARQVRYRLLPGVWRRSRVREPVRIMPDLEVNDHVRGNCPKPERRS